MTTYALVHGGAHGGWCWELVVPELEQRGHRAVFPDLPIEDPAAGARAWADVVAEALAGTDDDVVVVGHSLGGLAVPVVATLRPVRHMVFLGAMVPVPGTVYLDYLATEPDAVTFAPATSLGEGVMPDSPPSGITWDEAFAGFYHDCPPDLARHAWERLRPQALTVFTEACPIGEWPDVPATTVVMAEDRAVNPAWSRRVARERIRSGLVELPGSHSPFYSRPGQLADVLAAL